MLGLPALVSNANLAFALMVSNLEMTVKVWAIEGENGRNKWHNSLIILYISARLSA